jgi:hypothetical protein
MANHSTETIKVIRAQDKEIAGLTSIYAAIKCGSLRARKYRCATIILGEDLERFLKSLPTLGGDESSKEGAGTSVEHAGITSTPVR